MSEMGFKMHGSSIVRSFYWIDWLGDHNRKYGGWGKIVTKLIIYEPISKKKNMCVCALKFKPYYINYRRSARGVGLYIHIYIFFFFDAWLVISHI